MRACILIAIVQRRISEKFYYADSHKGEINDA